MAYSWIEDGRSYNYSRIETVTNRVKSWMGGGGSHDVGIMPCATGDVLPPCHVCLKDDRRVARISVSGIWVMIKRFIVHILGWSLHVWLAMDALTVPLKALQGQP